MDERYPGGESPIENYTRISNTFARICKEQIEENHQENILIVTHGGVINMIYHILKEQEWTNTNKPYPIANTSIHKIEWNESEWRITEENKIEHLN
ncbi:putative phosphoglycerate mutase [Lederbergia galactosidilyticus]|nr:putative phosphoglycerate mutase [Lederbergia galactosidilytica]